jgi:predicted Rossmann fold flavoprotein
MAREYDVIVIGGGAAGMMAAGRSAQIGKRVLLLEKNARLGKKLAISGGGRCNILNAEEHVQTLLGHYRESGKFLASPFSQFGMQEAYEFFESLGLPLKVETKKRAFPASEKASDVVDVLKKYMETNGVEVALRSPVSEILISEWRHRGNHGARRTNHRFFLYLRNRRAFPSRDGFDRSRICVA